VSTKGEKWEGTFPPPWASLRGQAVDEKGNTVTVKEDNKSGWSRALFKRIITTDWICSADLDEHDGHAAGVEEGEDVAVVHQSLQLHTYHTYTYIHTWTSTTGTRQAWRSGRTSLLCISP
jgi:hypothetical protein